MPPLLDTLLLSLVLAAPGASPIAGVDAKLLAGPAGESRLELVLDPAIADSWRQANVGLAVLRDPSGQRSLLPADRPDAKTVALAAESAFDEGCGVIVAEVGPALAPAKAPRPDAWRQVTRAVKLFLCRPSDDPAALLADRRALTSIATAKAGTRVEIRPLANPLALEPGSDLPVRLYSDQIALGGATVTAHGPDGAAVTARADPNGIAVLRLATPGRWLLRLDVATGDVPRRAEVLFELLPREVFERAGETS
jgi:hypothetical protein